MKWPFAAIFALFWRKFKQIFVTNPLKWAETPLEIYTCAAPGGEFLGGLVFENCDLGGFGGFLYPKSGGGGGFFGNIFTKIWGVRGLL